MLRVAHSIFSSLPHSAQRRYVPGAKTVAARRGERSGINGLARIRRSIKSFTPRQVRIAPAPRHLDLILPLRGRCPLRPIMRF
jgi:hypothetical protein